MDNKKNGSNNSKYNVLGGISGATGDNATGTVIINPKQFNPDIKIMQTNLSMLSDNFTGRKEYISKIESLLTKQGIITICGNGGIGKTQIVLKYIKSYEKKYTNIVFINASSSETITLAYSNYLEIENDENIVSRMRNWSRANKDWLFVYDNIDDKNLKSNFFEKYMIDPTNGKVIITSRISDWEKIIKIDKFMENESVDFLEEKTGLENREGARLLAKELDNFPLALEQAGAYIKNSRKKSYENYIKFYKISENRLKLLFEREKPDKYHETIAKTWQISIDKIANELSCSKDLLYIISFFAPDNIPIDIFEKHREFLSLDLKNLFENELNAEELFTLLENYSIITIDEKYMSVHKLVQEVIKLNIDQNTWYIYSFNLAYNSFNYDYNNQDTWNSSIEIVPHLLSITDYTYKNGFEKENTAASYNNLAFLYDNQGKYEEAEPLYIKSLKISEEVLGTNHPSTADSYNNLAGLYDNQGKYEESESLYIKSLKIREEVLGTNHPDTATSYWWMAIINENKNDYKNSEQLYLKALKIYETVLGVEHPKTVSIKKYLKKLHEKIGKL